MRRTIASRYDGKIQSPGLHSQPQASLRRFLADHGSPHAESALALELQAALVELAAEDHPAVQRPQLVSRQVGLVPQQATVVVQHAERYGRAGESRNGCGQRLLDAARRDRHQR